MAGEVIDSLEMGGHEQSEFAGPIGRRFLAALLLLIAGLPLALGVVSAQAQEMPLALVGGTVFPAPGAAPIKNAVLVLRDGRIAAVGPRASTEVPADAEVLDVAGRFVTAGFWNAHVHFTGDLIEARSWSPGALEQRLSEMFLRWGFVTVVDTGSWLENTLAVRRRIESGEARGPRILTAGSGFVPVGASPYYVKPVRLPELSDPEQVRLDVNGLIDSGADLVKLFAGSWATPESIVPMEPELVRAATDTAHERGVLVFAHPSNSTGARVAIEGGVDVLAHTFPNEFDGPWDRKLPAAMAARGTALVPTLKLWRWELNRIGLNAAIVDRIEGLALEQLAAAHEAGVTILFGTDVGYMADPDTTREFRLMAAAGMDHDAILASLTTAPSDRFGMAERAGRLAPGFEADVVVLDADPRDDAKAFAQVGATIRGGKVVYTRDR